jgi:hypothetical protein
MELRLNAKPITAFKPFQEAELLNGIYIVVLHATRIPPHIGMIIDKTYHSLTIKGHDINTPVKALIKNIEQRRIPSLFIKIKAHHSFSQAYQKEHFMLNVQQFPGVDKQVATCLSPLKLFFDEVYELPTGDVHFLFDLLPRLNKAALIEHCTSLFIDEHSYELPVYTQERLEEEIENARAEISGLQLSKS